MWEGKPEGVYAGKESNVSFNAKSDSGAEIYIAGGKIEKNILHLKLIKMRFKKFNMVVMKLKHIEKFIIF